LALGATFDPQAVEEAESCVAAELAASGVHIALVSGLDMARDPRWGRCEECFGEDPFMAARMCEAIVVGMQGENRSKVGKDGVAVVLKHLAAQGEAVGGRNGQSAVIGRNDLEEIHLPPVAAGARAGALGFMSAYNDIDEIPCCANPWLLKTYLRDTLGFDGIVMADGLAVDRLEVAAGSIPAAGRLALLSGVDVSLWDEGFTTLADSYADDADVVEAVDRSLRRVLEMKAMFGLLPGDDSDNDGAASEIGTASVASAHKRDHIQSASVLAAAIDATKQKASQLASKSLVLLKDGSGLIESCARAAATGIAGAASGEPQTNEPLAGPIVVCGPFADDFNCFLGDYTAPVLANEQTTIYRELEAAYGGSAHVVLARTDAELENALRAPVSMVVAVVGGTSERSYESEFADNGAAKAVDERGASGGEGVDLADVSLPWGQDELLKKIRSASSAPLLTVVVAGRAHVLSTVMDVSDAVIWAGYAGQFGPQAVVKTLVTGALPSGRMPVTLGADPHAIPVRYNDRQSSEGIYKDVASPVLAPFGYGLGAAQSVTFTDFNVAVGPQACSVTVKATAGQTPAEGSVLLYAHRYGGAAVPRLREVVGATTIDVAPGESCNLNFTVPLSALSSSTFGTDGVSSLPGATKAELWLSGQDDVRKEVAL
jgi:beta-glucosidase